MNPTATARGATLTMSANTAADLMTPSPITLREDATVEEALTCLTDQCVGGVVVVDAVGRPVGVLTESDLIVHARERSATAGPAHADQTLVRDVMTPTLFTLKADAPATKVIEHMRSLNIHRIFVIDREGAMVGVVTALDLLRRLELPE